LQENDEFFERQKQFLLTYNTKIKDATTAADKSTRAHKSRLFFSYEIICVHQFYSAVADTYIKLSSGFNTLSTSDKTDLSK
jgi:hypothetical protein